MKPGTELALALESVNSPKGRHKGLLNRVLRVLVVPQNATTNGEHSARVGSNQGFEGLLLARTKRSQKLYFVKGREGHHLNLARTFFRPQVAPGA